MYIPILILAASSWREKLELVEKQFCWVDPDMLEVLVRGTKPLSLDPAALEALKQFTAAASKNVVLEVLYPAPQSLNCQFAHP